MKILLYIRDLGGGQPVIQVNGTTGQMYPLVWEPKCAAHVRRWDVSTPEGAKVFQRESLEILNQRLMWPVLVDVEEGPATPVAEESQRAITALKAEVAALKEKLLEVGEKRGGTEGEPSPALSRQQKAAITRMARKSASK